MPDFLKLFLYTPRLFFPILVVFGFETISKALSTQWAEI